MGYIIEVVKTIRKLDPDHELYLLVPKSHGTLIYTKHFLEVNEASPGHQGTENASFRSGSELGSGS